jgi:hypothetical protein
MQDQRKYVIVVCWESLRSLCRLKTSYCTVSSYSSTLCLKGWSSQLFLEARPLPKSSQGCSWTRSSCSLKGLSSLPIRFHPIRFSTYCALGDFASS